MVGKYNRDTSSVTATPSTVTSSSAAFGRWAFGIGQPRRDRRGRTGYCERGIGSIRRGCLDHFVVFGERHLRHLLRRTFHSTRPRRRREPSIPLVAFCLRHFLADFIICMCEFDFRQAQVATLAEAIPLMGPDAYD